MMRGSRGVAFCVAIAATVASLSLGGQQAPTLPLRPGSVRFAAIGDMGTGKPPQYELAARMETARKTFPFEFVLTLGDNIYGGNGAGDFQNKFEVPYKPLLDAGVKFYASLGNHDNPSQRLYKPFNMGGHQYYTYTKGNAQFFALDSNYMSPQQLAWLEKELKQSDAQWKICYFHHPLYSSAAFHGSAVELRQVLEPLFLQYGVQVVFAGHEHVYERVKPQKGITYFIEGAAGQLRKGNLTKGSTLVASGYDRDLSFVLVEIAGDAMSFQTISRLGTTVDSGVILDKTSSKPETK
jgi:predicted MPP superfamily phosphohydrolase